MSELSSFTQSLIIAAITYTFLSAIVGYILEKWTGLLILAVTTALSFYAFHKISLEGSLWNVALLMLVMGMIWAILCYLLVAGRSLLLIALVAGLPIGLRFTLVLHHQLIKHEFTFLLPLVLIATGIVAAFYSRSTFWKRRGPLAITVIWYGFCLLFWTGHLLLGPTGVLTIASLAAVLFVAVLFVFAGWYTLPLEGSEQRLVAIKSMLTFALGTNFPYDVVGDRDVVRRVPGNSAGQLLSGPGIVLTGADHTVAIWDGLGFINIPEPGLAFTQRFQAIRDTFDLRPQLRSFTVEARTKDGIAMRVVTFIPHRVDAGKNQPQLGKPYPFFRRSILKILNARMVEHRREGAGKNEIEFCDRQAWDQLVPTMARRILTNIIAEYSFDELCAPFEPGVDPRTEIKTRLLTELRAAVKPWGLQLIGGGISNLYPVDREILKTRIENWRVSWTPKILKPLAEGEAAAMKEMERARILARAELIERVAAHPQLKSGDPEKISRRAIAFHLTSIMEELLGNQLSRRSLPHEVSTTLEQLRETLNNTARLEQKAEPSKCSI